MIQTQERKDTAYREAIRKEVTDIKLDVNKLVGYRKVGHINGKRISLEDRKAINKLCRALEHTANVLGFHE